METYITILRGINVSGHRIIKMDTLKKLFEKLQFENVVTYIQSGNIVFTYPKTNIRELCNLVTQNILTDFGFDVPAITVTASELTAIVEDNPYLNDRTKDPAFFHVTFLSEAPNDHDIHQLKKMPEEFAIKNKAVYLYCPSGYSKSKLTNAFLEKALNVTATTRNWKTVVRLMEIARK